MEGGETEDSCKKKKKKKIVLLLLLKKCFSQKSVNKPRSTQNYVNKRTARNEIVRQTTRQEEREMEKEGKLHSRRTDKEADAKHLEKRREEKRREEQRRSIDAREKQGRSDKEKAARTAGTNKTLETANTMETNLRARGTDVSPGKIFPKF